MPPASSILETPGGAIEFTVQGQGPAVLSLHGAGGGFDQGLWAAQMLLGDGYRIVSVSRFGYLRSPIPAQASIEWQAAQYAQLLDHLHIDKVILLGTSAGGPSATQFANDYPGRTVALILFSAVSAAPLPGDKPPFFIHIIHLIQRSDTLYWLVTRLFRSQFLSLVGIPPALYAQFDSEQKRLAQQMLDTMHPMSQRYKGTINDEQMIRRRAASTEAVTAPVLILHAADDALVSHRHAELSRAAIPHAQMPAFPTGGHGMLSQLAGVRRQVQLFLASVASPQ